MKFEMKKSGWIPLEQRENITVNFIIKAKIISKFLYDLPQGDDMKRNNHILLLPQCLSILWKGHDNEDTSTIKEQIDGGNKKVV